MSAPPCPGLASTAAPAISTRRAVFAALVITTITALAAAMVRALDGDGLDAVDLALVAAFGVTLPWTAVGFWNAVIGLVLLLGTRDAARVATPVAALGHEPVPIDARTALLVCIRNEDPVRLERNLGEMLAGLAALPHATGIEACLLSDSDRPDLLEAETAVAASLAQRFGPALRVSYRRRETRVGFKAGNLREFCERRGAEFDFAIVLDADSVMSPAAILRLIRIMQAEPRLGIVQTLVVGLPSESPFARVFQFGMRLGMRSYTLGSAWWQGDCGPYWGHNAILRMRPFVQHCALPTLPGRGPLSGPVLSHDQVEAVLMRRAGYDVRVLPLEDGSWEESPPTLLEFMRRDLRWCQGNLQYLRLLGMPGLRTLSRLQLGLAVLMFAGSPAWLTFVLLASFRELFAPTAGPAFRADVGGALAVTVLAMVFAPKLASVVAVLASRRRPNEFGPAPRFLAGVAIETVFSMLLAPVMAVAHSLFIGGLVFGRTTGWSAQARDSHGVPLAAALRALWGPTLLGAAMLAWFVQGATGPAWLFAPFWLPLLAAAPFASLTAWPALGLAMARWRIASVPDELAASPLLRRLRLPALDPRGGAPAGTGSRGRAAPHPPGDDAGRATRSLAALDALRTAGGVLRSLWIYRWREPARRRRMAALYARFLRPGDLAFDIGAHVGDRVDAFLALGCRVVAAEPQPALRAVLHARYGRRRDVTLVGAALGNAEGTIDLLLNLPNPTVSTTSAEFVVSADGAPGWHGQRWEHRLRVRQTTLDALIAAHGRPAFVKIDVEGVEDRVLAGLGAPVPALSFEFTTLQPAVALAALRRCAALGRYRFDASLGESHCLVHGRGLDADEMAAWIAGLPPEVNSGDVYAVLEPKLLEPAMVDPDSPGRCPPAPARARQGEQDSADGPRRTQLLLLVGRALRPGAAGGM
jgi:membrane glycosyltransferase